MLPGYPARPFEDLKTLRDSLGQAVYRPDTSGQASSGRDSQARQKGPHREEALQQEVNLPPVVAVHQLAWDGSTLFAPTLETGGRQLVLIAGLRHAAAFRVGGHDFGLATRHSAYFL